MNISSEWVKMIEGNRDPGVIRFNRSRVAVHEAGHAVMAMLLGLDILECDISRGKGGRGRSGRCVVIDPDPVGFRRFLVSMGGILAEHAFFGDDRGGEKDRHDAGLSLFIYSSGYRRDAPDPRAEGIVRAVSDHFSDPVCRWTLSEIAAILDREGRLDTSGIAHFERMILRSVDTSRVREDMDSFLESSPRVGMLDAIRGMIYRLKEVLERIRGF